MKHDWIRKLKAYWRPDPIESWEDRSSDLIINDIAAQGDILFIRVATLPEGAILQPTTGEAPIVAHSESGHHHRVRPSARFDVEHYVVNPMTSAVRIIRKGTELRAAADDAMAAIDAALGAVVLHEKSGPDAHEAFGLACEGEEAIYQINRQEELRPEGWVQVND